MELIINTISNVTVAINNTTLATRPFFPLIGNNGNDTSWNPTPWDWNYNAFFPLTVYETGWDNFTQGRARLGPTAMHNRLMTDAEILESYQERRVQNIAAVTQIYWDWREVTGNATWDMDETHAIAAIRSTLSTPIGIPEGADGTVTVPDGSGNDNDIAVYTRATYDDLEGALDIAADVRGWIGFLSDPFWK